MARIIDVIDHVNVMDDEGLVAKVDKRLYIRKK